MRHSRSPCVEHGGDADTPAKMLAIGRDGQHRLRRRLEQQVINKRFVLERYIGNLGRQREHDAEVPNRKQTGLAFGKPCPRGGALALWAVPIAAGVVGDPPMAATLAGLDVTAKGSGAAVLYRRHYLHLRQAHMSCMRSPIRRPSDTEDVGDLDRGGKAQPSGEASSCFNRPSLSNGLVTVQTVLVATLA
ncbi:hypothetical protein HNQ75_004561 [Rhizobium flavum]|uniref:Uncharacterized protein n=1 Tax=Pseudorhizobium flavum TaxID=1335061 RepID=A0A7W9Z277_9HYPH|nr:hypothetical protein [Pseudorhizobium flavum]